MSTFETTDKARAWDELAESYVAGGLCRPCAARATHGYSKPCQDCTCDHAVTDQGRAILRFVTSWTDHCLSKDLDSALQGCLTTGDRKALQGYAKLRQATSGWQPKRTNRSNARAVPAAAVTELGAGRGRNDKLCQHCGESFTGKGRASYCGESCSRAARRGRERARRAA